MPFSFSTTRFLNNLHDNIRVYTSSATERTRFSSVDFHGDDIIRALAEMLVKLSYSVVTFESRLKIKFLVRGI